MNKVSVATIIGVLFIFLFTIYNGNTAQPVLENALFSIKKVFRIIHDQSFLVIIKSHKLTNESLLSDLGKLSIEVFED